MAIGLAPIEMGAGIAASPHLRRDMDLPVFASLTSRSSSALRSWLTSSGVASDRGPDRNRVLDLSRPFLGWFLRVACPQGEPRTATGRPTLPAPLPVVRLGPKPSSSPSGGDRSFRHLPRLLAVSGFPVRRGLPSRSQIEPAQRIRVAQSEKCGLTPVDNGDIGRKS